MLKNYFTIALRNFSRSKAYSLINIVGLSLGISSCLLLALYVKDELSFDKQHERKDDLYRIVTHFDAPRHGLDRISTTSPPTAQTMKAELPEVEAAARMVKQDISLVKYGDNIFYETEGFIADSTIFSIFTYSFVEGSREKALAHANTVVITDNLSKKLFGNRPALGKTIAITQQGKEVDYVITGVIKDDTRMHTHVNFFTSMLNDGPLSEHLRSEKTNGEWAGMNFVPSYLKLIPGHDLNDVVRKMNQVLLKHGQEDMKALGFTKTLELEPVQDIYLKSDVQQSPRITYLYVAVSTAIFILLIACINFMNLSTARASKRAAEFGVRKIMGAYRSALISQILGEAMINVLISIFFSVVIVQLALPVFNDIIGKNISFSGEHIGYIVIALSAIALTTGLVAGSYPAFYFSSLQPAQVLKGKFNLNNASGMLRRSLVVFQFMIAIVLVCGTIIILKQLRYLQEKDLGFNAEAKIVLPLRTNHAKTNYPILQRELSRRATIKSVSAADKMPGSSIIRDLAFYAAGETMETSVPIHQNYVDQGFQELLGIKLLAGRTFTNNRSAESQRKVILNRAAAEQLGLDIDRSVGQKIFNEWQGQKSEYEIIGVMENYHQTSLKEEILPVMFEMPQSEGEYDFVVASISSEDFEETIASIEKTWKSLVHDTPFEYSFLDESIAHLYDEDRKVSRIITGFTGMAMLISCLGLYGLSSYMAERRIKEIGVRKVMGAGVHQIVSLMSKEFVKLVFVAFLISIPIAWYAMDKWLQGFAYKTSIDTSVFVYAGLGALCIALLTVSFESIKAATTNPVDSLKNE